MGISTKSEKIREFRSPFGVTISMKTVIFISFMKYGHENPGGAQELKTVEIVMKNDDFRIVPRETTGAIQKF